MSEKKVSEYLLPVKEQLCLYSFDRFGENYMEALEDAVKKAAPMYKKLSNKEQFITIIKKKLGNDLSYDITEGLQIPEDFAERIDNAYAEGVAEYKKQNKKLIKYSAFAMLGVFLAVGLYLVFKPGPPHVHNYETELIDARCNAGGYTRHFCNCGDEYVSNLVDELGHNWGDWIVIREPTLDENGTDQRECIRCLKKDSRAVPKLALDHRHTYKEPTIEKKETCISTGLYYYYCTHENCAAYVLDVVEKSPHNYSSWENVLKATETEKGERSRKCTECGYVQTEIIPALNSKELIMTGSTSYKSGKVSLLNSHVINDYTGFDGNHVPETPVYDNFLFSDPISVTAAANGAVYMLAVSKVDNEKMEDTVSLFKMRANGWEKLYDHIVPFVIETNNYVGSNYSRKIPEYDLNIWTDANSSVYITVQKHDTLSVYRYVESEDKLEFLDSVNAVVNLDVSKYYVDESAVYLFAERDGMFVTCRFNFVSGKFSTSGDGILARAIVDVKVKDGKVYFVSYESVGTSTYSYWLYCVENFGLLEEEIIYFTPMTEEATSIGASGVPSVGTSGIAVGENGLVYVLNTHRIIGDTAKKWLELITVDSSGNVIATVEHQFLYSTSSQFIQNFLLGKDGCLYFIEASEPFAVGMFYGDKFEKSKEVAVFRDSSFSGAKSYEAFYSNSENGIFMDMIYTATHEHHSNVRTYGYMRFYLEY